MNSTIPFLFYARGSIKTSVGLEALEWTDNHKSAFL